MSNHAEICPVCNGAGKYKEYTFFRDRTTTQTYIEKTCHGCEGLGWVTVTDEVQENLC